MQITCPHCGKVAEKPASAVNRARQAGARIYCSIDCSHRGRRKDKTIEQKKAEKAEYDRYYRAINYRKRKRQKAAWFQANYDPKLAAVKRRERMPHHVEYCRQPAYRKWKSEYDRRRRAVLQFGEFADAALLAQDIDREIKERVSRYEIYQENGRLSRNAQKRKRAAAAGSVALG